jgi:Xaa-Pro aminopeptidase
MTTNEGLTVEGCRARQERLRTILAQRNLQAALFTDTRYVHYFCGHFTRPGHFSSALIVTDGPTILSAPSQVNDAAAEEVRTFTASKLATQVDGRRPLSFEPLRDQLAQYTALGCDWAVPEEIYAGRTHSIADELKTMRRAKDADEMTLIRRAIAGTEAAYARAREIIEPGVSEVRIYAEMLAAATEAVGEPLGEMGNDFQSGAGGGAPRMRPVEAGELMPLDVSVIVRGYSSDLCRTFSIDGTPTADQKEAHARLVAALQYVENTARSGGSCISMYNEINERLNGDRRWKFPHHLGHGIGMSPHEAPRLNPNWDDTFTPGDVFTAEPGLYGPSLKTGIRLEENYLVTEDGLEKLSHFPLEL